MSTATLEPRVHAQRNYLNADYGWKSWLFTLDHKRIALLYRVSVTFFFVIGGSFAVLMRIHLVDPGGALGDLGPLHLGQAAAHRDLHAVLLLRQQVAQVPVQPVGRVLADRAGVEHDQVGRAARRRALVAGVLKQARDTLGIVHVHLAPVGADLVRPSFSHLTRIGVHAHRHVVSWYWMGP